MNIEVIGPGCPRCQKTEKRVKSALDRLDDGVDADVTKVEEQMEIIERGVMHTPAVAVDGEVKTEGEIPDVDQLVEVFRSS
ncbi:MAG: thioredoxin family protein [Haloferacaceae archaeon]